MFEHSPITLDPAVTRVPVRVAVFNLLRHFGMTTIFGNPGSTELPMLRDFPDDFRYVLGLQECCVIGMADGFAQANRNAAFVNLHSAAGVGHGLGNLFTAFKNRTPLVVTAGQQARSILPYDPFLFAQQAAEFPKPYVKWSCEPARAEDVPAAIARAYYIAMTPPQGPCFVSVPIDDWDRECDSLAPRVVSQSVRADPALLARLGTALDQAKRPVFVVGAACSRDQAWEPLVRLAERHQALVWETPHSPRNDFPQDHKLFAGFLPASREGIVKALTGHDVIVALGGPLFTYHVEGFGAHAPPDAEVFHLTDDPDTAAWLPTGTSIVTSLRQGILDLLDRAPPGKRTRQLGRKPRPDLQPSDPLTDTMLMNVLDRLRPAGAIVVEEAPSSRTTMQANLRFTEPDSFFTCSSGGLGHGLPAAVGIAMARPDQRVIGLIGDGSSMYAIQGLWTAGALGLPMTFIIIKNGRYEALISFGRLFGLQSLVGVNFPQIDFCSLACGMNVAAMRVDKAADLEATLRAALASTGPTLVEVVVE
jgi:benzoylformate decarboxylase